MSGESNLCELPKGWEWSSLDKLCTLHNGDRGKNYPSKKYFVSTGIPFVNAGHLNNGVIEKSKIDFISEERYELLRAGRLRPKDILFCIRGSLGKYALCDLEKGAIASSLVILRALDPQIVRYLMAYFASPIAQNEIGKYDNGTAQPNLAARDLAKFAVPIAGAQEQVRIASKIDELFSQIDEGERALARVRNLVERYRQSVLKAAVTGELTREWREARRGQLESGQALLARILKARREAWEKAELEKMIAKGKPPANDKWKQKYKEPVAPDTSDLPELPEGWVWASPPQLESDIANSLTIGPFGSNLKVSDYRDCGVPLIFVRNIRSGKFGVDDRKYVSESKAIELSSHIARAGDVLVTKMGDPPGDSCVYPANMPDAVVTADCIKWTLHTLMPSAEFVSVFINSLVGRYQIQRITKGVAQQKVSLSNFRTLGVALPGPEEQLEIAEQVEIEMQRLDSVLESIKSEQFRSGQLRQAVLRSAFSGQLIPQDPTDEPASTLLERIAAERAAQPAAARRGRKRRL